MEFIAIIVGALLGWQRGTIGRHEAKAIALVVAGWTAGTTAAAVPYVTAAGVGADLLAHAVVVTAPYALGVLAHRLARRRR